MMIINEELKNKLCEMAEKDQTLARILYDSQKETKNLSVYQNDRYSSVYNKIKEELHLEIKEKYTFEKKETGLQHLLDNGINKLTDKQRFNKLERVIKELQQIKNDLIDKKQRKYLPKQERFLLEMAMDLNFSSNDEVYCELLQDSLKDCVRAYVKETMREELSVEMEEFIKNLTEQDFGEQGGNMENFEKTNVVETPDEEVVLQYHYRGYLVVHAPKPEFGVLNWMFEPLDKVDDEEREWRTSEEQVIEAIDDYVSFEESFR